MCIQKGELNHRVRFHLRSAPYVVASSLAAQQRRRRRPDDERCLDDVAARLGLDAAACLDRAWSSLSGGEAHRALLAVHVSLRPAVLLLDEPTAACDAASAALVEGVLAGCGAGVLWVSHDADQSRRVGGMVYRFPRQPSGAEL
jgi:ATPase subunit of ABC transporter with duplicated ATPase domains